MKNVIFSDICVTILLDDRRLRPRTHQFPFQFALPEQLPTSFEGVFGSIRYFITVSIEIPYQPKREFEERITIIRTIDENDPDLQVCVTFFICSLAKRPNHLLVGNKKYRRLISRSSDDNFRVQRIQSILCAVVLSMVPGQNRCAH